MPQGSVFLKIRVDESPMLFSHKKKSKPYIIKTQVWYIPLILGDVCFEENIRLGGAFLLVGDV